MSGPQPTRLARRRGRPWTDEDDRAIRAARADDLKRVAVLLERTHIAALWRRKVLGRLEATGG